MNQIIDSLKQSQITCNPSATNKANVYELQQQIMQADKYFKNSTIFFYEAKYDQALNSINQYLQIRAGSSLAYSNRALIHFYLANHTMAKEDIETSLQLNHLNYIAYYNLFSIYAREKQYLAALKVLRLAVAAMCLIKGRLTKDLNLLQRSLELTDNNFDALVLYLLLNIQAQNYSEGLTVIEAARNAQQNNGILQKLRAYLLELQHSYSPDTEESLYDYLLQITPRQQKLQGKQEHTCHLIQEQINAQINAFLAEFNQLYSDLNKRVGGASYLIAKTEEKRETQRQSLIQDQVLKTKEMIKSS